MPMIDVGQPFYGLSQHVEELESRIKVLEAALREIDSYGVTCAYCNDWAKDIARRALESKEE